MTQYSILGRREYVADERDYTIEPKATTPQDRDALQTGWRYWWQDGWWGDQWFTPQCVAYAWTHWLEDGPVTQAPYKPNRVAVHGQGQAVIDPNAGYHWMQNNDEWPGTDYDGTSVRAGAKYLLAQGLITEYKRAWTIDNLIKTVLVEGPVVVGTNWSNSMMEPDDTGTIHYEPHGNMYGHAYLLNGVSLNRNIFRIKNSWGRGWGDDGTAEISIVDMESLINANGEAWIAVEKAA